MLIFVCQQYDWITFKGGNTWEKGKPSGSTKPAWGKWQPRFYWNCSSIVMNMPYHWHTLAHEWNSIVKCNQIQPIVPEDQNILHNKTHNTSVNQCTCMSLPTIFSSFLGSLLYMIIHHSEVIGPQMYQVSSQLNKKCKKRLLDKLEKYDWHIDCYMPHCNTFVHVDSLLSIYLIWHLSKTCKQYKIKYMENTLFLKSIYF